MTLGGRAWPWKTGRVGMSMVRFLLPQRGKDSPGQVRRLGKIRTGAVAVTVVCPVTTQGRDAWRWRVRTRVRGASVRCPVSRLCCVFYPTVKIR